MPQAVRDTLAIVETFVKIRQLSKIISRQVSLTIQDPAPAGKTKSITFTETGLCEFRRMLAELFAAAEKKE